MEKRRSPKILAIVVAPGTDGGGGDCGTASAAAPASIENVNKIPASTPSMFLSSAMGLIFVIYFSPRIALLRERARRRRQLVVVNLIGAEKHGDLARRRRR